MTRNELLRRIAAAYDVPPDYPFPDDAVSAVFRHAPSRKWFALVMRVSARALGLTGESEIDVVNLKCDPLLIGSLRLNPAVRPAYHMNKEHWITVLIDAAADDDLMNLVDISYRLTGRKK